MTCCHISHSSLFACRTFGRTEFCGRTQYLRPDLRKFPCPRSDVRGGGGGAGPFWQNPPSSMGFDNQVVLLESLSLEEGPVRLKLRR